ncbi:PREDICTED: putative uncharacterized protein DDB_G0282133 [Diuraphis noxia]|uniref:putative uncharacterized protein DDB_G0282133 n=1 Tax=Diuraphis noxia TaxID=143948 RepID=UPI000763809A|nr:PREDICTED: putative uncharacterized protein DDB_G0282133 [Diuraphis noxia]
MSLLLNSKGSCRHSTTVVVLSVAVLLTVGQVQNLKCRTADHSRRHGEFIDIAEQCNNTTSGDRSASAMDGDYSTYASGGSGDNDGRWNGDGRRNNNNREFSVNRQDFGGNRGSGGGSYDRDQCGEARPQQYSGNTGSRSKNHRQGSYPSVDYDSGQSNSNHNRQPLPMRRYRRDDSNDKNKHQKAVVTGNNNRLLGNNRFRNVTKTGGNQQGKGTYLDKMDAISNIPNETISINKKGQSVLYDEKINESARTYYNKTLSMFLSWVPLEKMNDE